MTTGIDYTTSYISLKPDENSRSIAELVEVENKRGYSDMTDDEISRLIKYKEHCAKEAALIEAQNARTDEQLDLLNLAIEQQKEYTEALSKIANAPVEFKRVGEDVGQE